MPDWITTAEAVALSGYHVEYIRELARDGKIEAQKWSRDWQIGRSSLLAHMRKMEALGERRGRPKQER